MAAKLRVLFAEEVLDKKNSMTAQQAKEISLPIRKGIDLKSKAEAPNLFPKLIENANWAIKAAAEKGESFCIVPFKDMAELKKHDEIPLGYGDALLMVREKLEEDGFNVSKSDGYPWYSISW